MPKSRIRKKEDFTPPSEKKGTEVKLSGSGNRWAAPLMLAMFLIGLAWVVVFYVTQGSMPLHSIGNWNVLIGFGFIAAGFVFSTQWK